MSTLSGYGHLSQHSYICIWKQLFHGYLKTEGYWRKNAQLPHWDVQGDDFIWISKQHWLTVGLLHIFSLRGFCYNTVEILTKL